MVGTARISGDAEVAEGVVTNGACGVTVTVLVDPPQPPAATASAAATTARFGMLRS
jgi:hypothetical protein